MRKSYLESFYDIIPKIQQDRLLEVLKKKYDDAGESPDEAVLQSQIEMLIAELKEPLGDPQVHYRPAKKYGKVSSEDYNYTMEEVYVDLGALFKQDNTISKTIKVHQQLNDAVIRDARAALRKVENDVMVYKVIKENRTGITDAVYNTFYNDDNKTEETIFSAWVDTDTNSIKLPAGMDHSATSLNGLSMAEISLVHYGGGIRGTLETEEHRKEKAIDESLDTFWGEVILTDEPIRQVYDGETYFGTICEITITLFRTELINYIKYTPFTNYPLSVIKIEYRDTVNSAWTDLDIESQSSVMAMEFNFNEVIAKEIKIVINQVNPSINTYKLPKQSINNAELWQQIVDREYSISTETDEPIQATQDMIDYISGWRAYSDAVESYKNTLKKLGQPANYINTESFSETIFDATTQEISKAQEGIENPLRMDLYGKKTEYTDELVEVRKYEYVYGAYDIDIKKIWYVDHGEYISPKYTSNGPILESELDVAEALPSGTSIEYSLSTRDNEWKNVMPSGMYINQERLDIDSRNITGILRFPASGVDYLYRNNDLIPAHDYSYTQSTREVELDSSWYVATAIYTASYEPIGISDVTPSGVVIDFSKDALIPAIETYTGSDSRQYKIELDHYPYVNYDIVNDTSKANATIPKFEYISGRWLNISGSAVYDIDPNDYYDPLVVTVDGYSAENRTDYYENIRPSLTPYNLSSYPNFDYFQYGKNLYFNTDVFKREIKVIYNYLNDYIQFKALLRSNVKKNVTVTPVLEDYTIKLRTI